MTGWNCPVAFKTGQPYLFSTVTPFIDGYPHGSTSCIFFIGQIPSLGIHRIHEILGIGDCLEFLVVALTNEPVLLLSTTATTTTLMEYLLAAMLRCSIEDIAKKCYTPFGLYLALS